MLLPVRALNRPDHAIQHCDPSLKFTALKLPGIALVVATPALNRLSRELEPKPTCDLPVSWRHRRIMAADGAESQRGALLQGGLAGSTGVPGVSAGSEAKVGRVGNVGHVGFELEREVKLRTLDNIEGAADTHVHVLRSWTSKSKGRSPWRISQHIAAASAIRETGSGALESVDVDVLNRLNVAGVGPWSTAPLAIDARAPFGEGRIDVGHAGALQCNEIAVTPGQVVESYLQRKTLPQFDDAGDRPSPRNGARDPILRQPLASTAEGQVPVEGSVEVVTLVEGADTTIDSIRRNSFREISINRSI